MEYLYAELYAETEQEDYSGKMQITLWPVSFGKRIETISVRQKKFIHSETKR